MAFLTKRHHILPVVCAAVGQLDGETGGRRWLGIRRRTDGFVTILGRAKRFAKLGGEMISLAAVEQLAADCWPEHQHAALSQPDSTKGERIILLTTKPYADRQKLIEAAQGAGLSTLYIPYKVLIVREIPLLGSGKPDYRSLQRLVADSIT